MLGFVGDVRGVVVLDNEGRRVISKYYNSVATPLESNQQQKSFERSLFYKSNKQSGKSGISTNVYENDIMIVDNYTAVFRVYSDMSIYILGHADDNELVLGQVLDCIHEVFDRIFKGQFERKSLISHMSSVILVIDEMIDSGIVMHTSPGVINERIKQKKPPATGVAAAIQEEHSASSSMFSSMFGAAKSSLARNLGL